MSSFTLEDVWGDLPAPQRVSAQNSVDQRLDTILSSQASAMPDPESESMLLGAARTIGGMSPSFALGMANRIGGTALQMGDARLAAQSNQLISALQQQVGADSLEELQQIATAFDDNALDFGALLENPSGAMSLIGQTLGQSAPDLLAGLGAVAAATAAGGSAMTPGGQFMTPAFAAAALVGMESALAGQGEYAAVMQEEMVNRLSPEDLGSPERIAEILNDPDYIKTIEEKGVPRAAAIAGVTAGTGFVGNAVAKGIRSTSGLSKAGRVLGEVALQGPIQEGGGEALAQYATEGEITKMGDVTMNAALGTLVQGPVSLMGIYAGGARPTEDTAATATEGTTEDLSGVQPASEPETLAPQPDLSKQRVRDEYRTANAERNRIIQENAIAETRNRLNAAKNSQPRNIPIAEMTHNDGIKVARALQRRGENRTSVSPSELRDFNIPSDRIRAYEESSLRPITMPLEVPARPSDSLRIKPATVSTTLRDTLRNHNLQADYAGNQIQSGPELDIAVDNAIERREVIRQELQAPSAENRNNLITEFRTIDDFLNRAEAVMENPRWDNLGRRTLLEDGTTESNPELEERIESLKTERANIEKEIENANNMLKNTAWKDVGGNVAQMKKGVRDFREGLKLALKDTDADIEAQQKLLKETTQSNPEPLDAIGAVPSVSTPARGPQRNKISDANEFQKLNSVPEMKKLVGEQAVNDDIKIKKDQSKILKAAQTFVSATNIAMQDQNFAELHHVMNAKMRSRSDHLNYLSGLLQRDFFQKHDKATINRVAETAMQARQRHITHTQESSGLNDLEWDAYQTLQRLFRESFQVKVRSWFSNYTADLEAAGLDPSTATTDDLRAIGLNEEAAALDEMQNRRLKHDYFPAERFGEWGLTIQDSNGDTQSFQTFDSERQLRNYMKNLRLPAGQRIAAAGRILEKDTLRQLAQNGQAGVLQAFNTLMGSKVDQANFQEELSKMLSKVRESAMFKNDLNLYKAEIVPGYSTDWERAINSYIMNTAGTAANVEWARRHNDALVQTKENSPHLKDYAERYVRQAIDDIPAVEWLHRVAFLDVFGLNVGAATLQMFGIPTVVGPQLQKFGINLASDTLGLSKLMSQAVTKIFTGSQLVDPTSPSQMNKFSTMFKTPDEKQLLLSAGTELSEGIFAQQAMRRVRRPSNQVMANKFEDVIETSGIMMRNVEIAMRMATVLQAYRKLGNPKALEKAKKVYADNSIYQGMVRRGVSPREAAARTFNLETNAMFGRWNEPALMSMAYGVPGLLFKYQNYPQQIIEGMVRAATRQGVEGKTAVSLQLLALVMAGGLMGLPLADDLTRLAEMAHKAIWKEDPMIEHNLMLWADNLMQENDFARHIFGTGIGFTRGPTSEALGAYVSERIALGSTPVTGGILDLLENRSLSLEEMGIPGMWKRRVEDMAYYADQGNYPAALRSALFPGFLKHLHKAMYEYEDKGAQTRRGDVYVDPSKITAIDKMMRAAGFEPMNLAKARQARWQETVMPAALEGYKTALREKWTEGYRELLRGRRYKDAERARNGQMMMNAVAEEIKEHNRSADQPYLKIDMDFTRAARQARSDALVGRDYRNVAKAARPYAMSTGENE